MITLIHVHQKTQDHCGAAAAEMVLSAYGVKVSQITIAKALLNKSTQIAGAKWIVIEKLADYVARQSKLHVFWISDIPIEEALNLLSKLISNEEPVLVLQAFSENSPRGHYRVVVGMTEKEVIVQDPWSALSKPRKMSKEEFAKLWTKNKEVYRDCQSLVVRKNLLCPRCDNKISQQVNSSLKCPTCNLPFTLF